MLWDQTGPDCGQCVRDFVAVDDLCADFEASMNGVDSEWEARIPSTCDEMCIPLVADACGIELSSKNSFFIKVSFFFPAN